MFILVILLIVVLFSLFMGWFELITIRGMWICHPIWIYTSDPGRVDVGFATSLFCLFGQRGLRGSWKLWKSTGRLPGSRRHRGGWPRTTSSGSESSRRLPRSKKPKLRFQRIRDVGDFVKREVSTSHQLEKLVGYGELGSNEAQAPPSRRI